MPIISEVKEIQLINLLGQEIQSRDNIATYELDGAIRIPVKDVLEGTYIIKVNTFNTSYCKKAIVKK